MVSDIEKFLQQAAERLAQKANQGSNQGTRRPAPKRPPPQSPRPSHSVGQAERSRRPIHPEVVDAQVVEAEVVQPSRSVDRRRGPDPLSSIDTRPELAQVIDHADEKMADRVHQDLDHEMMHLSKASSALDSDQTGKEGHGLTRHQYAVSPLVDMLRNPETLRAAFIAGEIFRRKF